MLQRLLPCFVLLVLLASCGRSPQPRYDKIAYGPPPSKPVSYKTTPLIPSKQLIVIDAGHGGKDLGAQSIEKPKHSEKNLTLSTAYMLSRYLQQMGYRTILTRDEDTFVPLKKRAEFANDHGCTLFVSVHYNAATNREAHGVEVYYYDSDKNKKRTEASKQVASVVLDSVIGSTEAKSRGIKHGNFAVIRETTMPAILVEGGFLTNQKEIKKIREAEYMQKVALGIAKGVHGYLKKMR